MGELSLEMGEWPPESPLTREWGTGGRSGSEEQRLHRGRGGGTDTAPHRPPAKVTFSPVLSHPSGPFSCPHQLLRMFFRQQDEIRRLKEELAQKDIRIRQLQLELKNLRNSPKNC